tara:strand:+ start:18385 stop:18834 length:450 start_codon:yes stop_codon:yes gene_type:complete
MRFLNLWKTNSKKEQGGHTLSNSEFLRIQKLIFRSNVSEQTQNDLHEILMILTKMIGLQETRKHNFSDTYLGENLDKFECVENEIKTQKVIINTLFQLVNQDCVTKEQVSNCKKELIIKVSKIEENLIHLFTGLTSKKDENYNYVNADY